jgi:hypothetical protein
VDQAQMLLKVFLFAINSGFFNFECVGVLHLDLSLLDQDTLDNAFKLLINLAHHLYFALFNLFIQIIALVNQYFGALG